MRFRPAIAAWWGAYALAGVVTTGDTAHTMAPEDPPSDSVTIPDSGNTGGRVSSPSSTPTKTKARPSNKHRTEELWLMLVTAFREAPANFAKVSARTGMTVAACKVAWEDGWADTPWGTTPISSLIAREHNEAARKAHEDRMRVLDKESEQARAERTAALQARDEERKSVNLTRANALGMAALSTQSLQSGRMLMAYVQNIISTLPPTQEGLQLALKALGSISLFQLRSQQLLRGALEAERILTGQPIAITGLQIESMTPHQIRDALQALLGTVKNSIDTADGINVQDADIIGDEAAALEAGEEEPAPITPEALTDTLARDLEEEMP